MPSFFDHTNYLNTLFPLNNAVEQYFADIVFDGDLNRVIYSSNAYAFRKRSSRSKTTTNNYNADNLRFPFINYYVTDISNTPTRKYMSNIVNLEGIYVPDTGKKIQVVPVQIQYESTIFVKRFDDLSLVLSKFLKENSNETILKPSVTYNGTDITFDAYLGYNFNFNTDYNETDWLNFNEIHTIGLNFVFDSAFLYINDEPVSITEEIIFNFLSAKDGYSGELTDLSPLDYKILLTEYFSS